MSVKKIFFFLNRKVEKYLFKVQTLNIRGIFPDNLKCQRVYIYFDFKKFKKIEMFVVRIVVKMLMLQVCVRTSPNRCHCLITGRFWLKTLHVSKRSDATF